MASILTQILTTLIEAEDPLTVRDLSLHLDLNPQVVMDMLAYWERRGRIRISERESCSSKDTSACAHCPVKNCDVTASVSKRYEIVKS